MKKASPLKGIVTRGTRLRRLLTNGYFPVELPPTFSTVAFGNAAESIGAQWEQEKWDAFWTEPEEYTVPRYGDTRRKLSIVNPINQYRTAKLIADNWQEIRSRLRRTKVSEFSPRIVLTSTKRAVTGVDFDGVARRRAAILASYGRYVRTDISRFYASIYTHSIAWSLLGKQYCKDNHNKSEFKNSFANQLDKALSAGQQGQTIGIPIGPDTSRIISELIATEVEQIILNTIPNLDNRAVRFVDDIIVGFGEQETAAGIVSLLSGALYEYGLEINAEKTFVLGVGIPHAPEWVHFIRDFQISDAPGRQREDIDSFFEQAVHLADQNHRENVLLYTAKRAAAFSVHNDNLPHLTRWMLYIARRSPNCLGFVAEHLAAIAEDHDLPQLEIEGYIVDLLPRYAEAARTDEVSWLLYWAIQLRIPLPANTLRRSVTLRSSIIAIQVAHLLNDGLIRGEIDLSYWRSFATAAGLKSSMWLATYEISKREWWGTRSSNRFLTDHKYFGHISEESVYFYEKDRKAISRKKTNFTQNTYFEDIAGPYPF